MSKRLTFVSRNLFCPWTASKPENGYLNSMPELGRGIQVGKSKVQDFIKVSQ
jgi:hypothetical protein